MRRSFASPSLSLSILLLSACGGTPGGGDAGTDAFVPERDDGDRTPRPSACAELDPAARCLLPWPSNAYTVADDSTETGLRLQVDDSEINRSDDPSSLSLADGFSRVGSVLADFPEPLDESSLEGAVHLVLAQHDHPDRGREEPLRFETHSLEDGQTLLLAHPRRPLEPAADYAVVITDALRTASGSMLEAPRPIRLIVGLDAAQTQQEVELVAHHAPMRRLLGTIGIDPERVLRAWDFTTRSAEDPRRALRMIREASVAAVDDGSAQVVIDSVETSDDPNVACIVYGRLTGLPEFLNGDEGFVAGEDRQPTLLGTRDAPFRVLVPAGTGDYRFVMYGHGTGGNERDDAFDAELAELGVAKVNVRFYGWTDDEVLLTFANLQKVFRGSFGAGASIAEALAHAMAIQRAMEGPLGAALRAPMLGTVPTPTPNPAAGRGPDLSARRLWVGGSLGGTTGVIYAAAEPSVHHAIVNVPGAAWAQWVWRSYTYDLIHGLIAIRYEDDIDILTALTIAQTNLDVGDGASWVDELRADPPVFLIQESMGDPVLPNPGTDMVSVIAGARQVGAVLEPVQGVQTTTEIFEASGLTQYRTTDTDIYDVHGFAARGSAAGVAAREQILEFLTTTWAGRSRIVVPPSCPSGNCDFTL